jgi:hypothetical protein
VIIIVSFLPQTSHSSFVRHVAIHSGLVFILSLTLIMTSFSTQSIQSSDQICPAWTPVFVNT